MKTNKYKKAILLFTVLTLILAGACSKQSTQVATPTAEATPQQQIVDVFGTVELLPKDIVNVTVDFPIVIEKINISEGQKVEKGDTLLIFNSKNLDDQIKSKEHELNIAKLEISKTIDSLSTYSSELKLLNSILEAKKSALGSNNDPDIKKLSNDLSYAKTAYSQADKELQKQQQLYTSGAISQHDYDEYKKSLAIKSKEITDAEYALKILKDKKAEEIKNLESSIAQKVAAIGDSKLQNADKSNSIKILQEKENLLQAELDSLKNKLSKPYIQGNKIISNYESSIVYDIGVLQGDSVTSDGKLFSIAKLDSVIIKANVSEEFINDVEVGTEAAIVPASNKAKTIKGKVTRIYNMANLQNGETVVPVEISLDDKDKSLIPNMNVDVTLHIK